MRPDCEQTLVVGDGIIGLSIALELAHRGHRACVLTAPSTHSRATTAAAGMLAAHDPHNPPQLASFAARSIVLYDDYLARIASISGEHVPYQTSRTLQWTPDSVLQLAEHSLDPRQLYPALLRAVTLSGITLLTDPTQAPAQPSAIVYATGAWPQRALPVRPVKGQMLRVRIPASVRCDTVLRRGPQYIVPRRFGPQAGTAIIGATVEDIGYDTTTHAAALTQLRRDLADLAPWLTDESISPTLEAWAGLRPATPDDLPILDELPPHNGTRQLVATGHFRNGILLAPATAEAIADLLTHITPRFDLKPFRSTRFSASASSSHTRADIRTPEHDNDFLLLR